MSQRVPGSMRTCQSLSDLIEGRLGSPVGRAELVKLATRLTVEEALGRDCDEHGAAPGRGMHHVRGAPNHPQTQGKIERGHQTLKNRILIENYYLPGTLEQAILAFIDRDHHRRNHESLANLTPADVYFGRGSDILSERRRIKEHTLKQRRLLNRRQAA